jgi:hypothetical protein
MFGGMALASCNVDGTVSLQVRPDGSGQVEVSMTADAEVVAAAPELAGDLRTDDLVAAGWTVEGPTPTDSGGLTVVLRRGFDTPAEATAILAGLNGDKGPLRAVSLARSGKDTNSTWTLAGELVVNGGLEAFVDNQTLELLGAAPYAGDVRAAGLDLGAAVTLRFVASLPGEIESTTAPQGGDGLEWRVPMDGSTTDIATITKNLDVAATVAGVARPVLLGLLVIWIGGAGFLAMMVRRAQTRRRPPLA